MIVMPDLVRHLLGSMVSQPYMKMLKTWNKSEGGILLGMGPFDSAYEDLAGWASGAKSFMCLDFKGFDQAVPARLIRMAMAHVARHYTTGPGTKAYWRSETRQLVNTEIVLPDGHVYRKRRGIASGDPWTSIVGSYANWLALRDLANVMGWNVKIWTFGDDSVIARYDAEFSKEDLAEATRLLYARWGMDVSPTKSYVTRHLVTIDDDPEPKVTGSFLSSYFLATPMGIRPVRPTQDLYEKMLKPEWVEDDVGWEIVRTSSAYLIFYYNDYARALLEEYWEWLHREFTVPELTGRGKDFRLLSAMKLSWTQFDASWLSRLPTIGEAELLYKYGHTGYFVPVLAATIYKDVVREVGGNFFGPSL